MRGTRAKKLHKEALKHPQKFNAGWLGKTFIQGGVRRAYLELKNNWREKIRGS